MQNAPPALFRRLRFRVSHQSAKGGSGPPFSGLRATIKDALEHAYRRERTAE